MILYLNPLCRYYNFSLVILRVNISLHLEGDTVPKRWRFYSYFTSYNQKKTLKQVKKVVITVILAPYKMNPLAAAFIVFIHLLSLSL